MDLSFQRLPSILRNRSIGLSRKIAFSFFGPRKSLSADKAMVICADPRGGSTWLYEILSQIRGVAGLWEPLNIGEVNHFRKLGFGHRHYIEENEISPEARQAFTQLFRGNCREPYILHRTSFRTLRDAEKIMVKFCRASQLLPWLTREFKFVHKPVHLVRHPCAVVASQIKYGAWDKVQPGFSQQQIMSDPLMRPHADILQRIDTVEARLAAVWAMTNHIALNHPQRHARWCTISYEDLVSNPADTLSVILEDWGGLDTSIDEIVGKPSQTTLGTSPILLGKQQEQLSYWQKSLTQEQIRNILNTVEALGVEIYGYGIKPNL